MDNKRFISFILVAIPIYVGTMMYVSYQEQANRKVAKPGVVAAPAAGSTGGSTIAAPPGTLTTTADGKTTTTVAAAAAAIPRREDLKPVTLKTKSYDIAFSLAGGVPISWSIIDPAFAHPDRRKRHEGDGEDKSGWIELVDPGLELAGLDRPLEIVLREANARYYNELNQRAYTVQGPREESGAHLIDFVSPLTESGLQVTKSYRIPDSGFQSTLTIKLANRGISNLSFNNGDNGLGLALGPGLGQAPAGGHGGWLSGGQYEATHAVTQSINGVKDLHVKLGQAPETVAGAAAGGIGWAGIHTRYFMMAAWPDAQTVAGKAFRAAVGKIDSGVSEKALASTDAAVFYPRLEVYGAPFVLAPGQEASFGYTVFAGPKDTKLLKASTADLNQILFHDSYRWVRGLALGLMWMLGAFHALLKSWGLSIIFLVITLRVATLPFTMIQMKHQAEMTKQMAKLKPHMDKINEKYKNDPQKKSEETMKLYREHNVNPLGMFKGCIWMLLQLPIFIALYKILGQAIDLRGASFLWIDDLSQPDRLFGFGFALPLLGWTHFNLLPILTAVTQMWVSKIAMEASPGGMDNPMQKQMMYMMPFSILIFTYQFPSGLVLYWLVSNLWQFVQQKFVNQRVLGPPAPAPSAAS